MLLLAVLAPLYSYASLKSPSMSYFRVLRNVHFAVGLFSIKHRWSHNVVRTRRRRTLGAGECVTDVPTALCRPL